MSYHQWWRRLMRLRHRCCPRRHFPRWGFPSNWRCLWASIHASKVGEECWNSSLYDRLDAMAISIHLEEVAASIQLQATAVATSKYTRLWETLPTTSRVLDPYKSTVTWKFDSCISKNLNSKLEKGRELYLWSIKVCDRRVHWDMNRMRRGMWTAQITLIICYQIELDKLSIY
jgi:hypothetical protein